MANSTFSSGLNKMDVVDENMLELKEQLQALAAASVTSKAEVYQQHVQNEQEELWSFDQLKVRRQLRQLAAAGATTEVELYQQDIQNEEDQHETKVAQQLQILNEIQPQRHKPESQIPDEWPEMRHKPESQIPDEWPEMRVGSQDMDLQECEIEADKLDEAISELVAEFELT